jgi:hypothetical protein
MYVCKKCKVNKPITEYYKTTDRKSGHKTICKECIKADPLTDVKKEYMKKYGKEYYLKTKYNLSKDEYNKLLQEHNHKCAICSVDEVDALKGKLYVDHCHNTGKIRGLLCHHCNTGIGMLKDSTKILALAISYLNKEN